MLPSNVDDATPAALAALGFHLFVAVVVRYVPEYLRILGARAWLVGLFGSTALALALAYPAVRAELRAATREYAPVAVGALAVSGLAIWLAAPFLGGFSLVVTELEPWAWVLAGLLFLRCWRDDGPRTALDALRRTDDAGAAARAETLRRAGLLGVVGVATGLFFGAPDFLSAFQVLLALAATAGLTATVAAAVYDDHDGFGGRDDESGGDGDRPSPPRAWRTLRSLFEMDSPVGSRRRRSPSETREPAGERVSRASSASRSLLVGDALTQFAVGMANIFVVVLVVHSRRFDVAAFGLHVEPEATFALLLAVETVVALFGAIPAARLADATNRRAVVGSGLLVAAVFPLALVAAPLSLVVAGVLFAAFGWYLATLPVRESLLTARLAEPRFAAREADSVFDAYRVVRRAAVVPAPLVGGLLYGFSPQLSFGLATCVGLLGCWEYLRFVRRVRRG